MLGILKVVSDHLHQVVWIVWLVAMVCVGWQALGISALVHIGIPHCIEVHVVACARLVFWMWYGCWTVRTFACHVVLTSPGHLGQWLGVSCHSHGGHWVPFA